MSIPEFSVNRRITISMLVLIIVLFGVVSYFYLGQDLLPEMDFPVMSVLTQYEGAKSEQVEKLITRPIEELMATLPDVQRITSKSQEGISIVTVELKWGTNTDQSVANARAKLLEMEQSLPSDSKDPLVLKMDMNQMPVIMYAVSGMDNGYKLRQYLEDVVGPQLEQVDGVAMVICMGGETREIRVEADPAKLDSFGLTLSQVSRAIQAENVDDTAGNIIVGPSENLLTIKGEFRTPEEIEEVAIAELPDRIVRVRDVAKIIDDYKDRRNRTRRNGMDCVLMAAMKQSGANTTTTGTALQKKLEELKTKMPPDIKFTIGMDMSEMIRRIVKFTQNNAIQGAILAVFFVWLFLKNWRPTLIIFLAIPISVLTAFIGMYIMGYTFNIMTLGGIALGVGMLVDNAVVATENTYRHLEAGEDRVRAAATGANEVMLAITASTFTTVAVFIPMSLVGGVASQIARPMSVTIVLSLLASLFVAITIVPAMTATLFRRRTPQEIENDIESFHLFKKMKAGYRQTLAYLVDKGWPVLVFVVVILAGALLIAKYNLGGEFMPAQDAPILFGQVELPVGSTLEETDRVVSVMEKYALEHEKELGNTMFMASVGTFQEDVYASSQGFNATDVNGATFWMRLKDQENRNLSSNEIQDRLRLVMPKISVEGAKMNFIDPFGSMMSTSGESASIVVRVFGDELDRLRDTAEEIKRRISGIKGIVDTDITYKEGKPEQAIRIDRTLAAQHGLTTGQVAAEIKTALAGSVISRYREGANEYDIRVRLAPSGRDRIEQMLDMKIATPFGTQIPLRQVASIEQTTGPLQVYHENRRRKVSVTANVVNRDLMSAMDEIQGVLADLDKKLIEEGSYLSYGGAYKDRQETVTSMTWAFIVSVILVYMVMAAQFESFIHPLIVMITVPLGIVGVVIGLALMGMTISLPSMLGFVILVGIVVNNAIVMIDFINQLRRYHGKSMKEAIVEGATIRLRPILITSLTTIAGMAPMAFSHSQGSQMRAPMAIAVGSGLLFSTLLTLFVIPTAYYYLDAWSDKIKASLAHVLYKNEPSKEETEAKT